ncbi:hypothetical protein BDR26DRAFT_806755, partial [Obelidium mucronatum]
KLDTGINSQTSHITEYKAEINGTDFTLIDTPGFDDSRAGNTDHPITDTDILKQIATYLADTYIDGQQLTGIIYMHRISDIRVGASVARNLRFFEKLCGSDFYKNVIILTTRWDMVEDDQVAAIRREVQLKEEAFKLMIDRGAKYMRFETIDDIAEAFEHLKKLKKAPTEIQKQIVDQKMKFDQTDAGKDLKAEIAEILKQNAKQLKEMKEDIEYAAKKRDEEHLKELEKERAERRAIEKRLLEAQNDLSEQLKKLTLEAARPPAQPFNYPTGGFGGSGGGGYFEAGSSSGGSSYGGGGGRRTVSILLT